MTISAEFLDRGVLPFVGRETQLQRLLNFWRGTLQSIELRAALLSGEAGIGKSRLIEELVPLIEQEGGVVVHTRLFPESTTAITPLIARALRADDIARRLLRQEPEENLSSAAAALRRLARLRPTLLVIEDSHLLANESLREFTLLLNAVAEEPMSVLCTARPVELAARGSLSRFMVEEIELPALSDLELGAVWNGIFEVDIDPELLDQLQQITLGNPLALRSALRGTVKAHGGQRRNGTAIRVPTSRELTKTLRQNVELLTEGMVAHLDEGQRQAAVKLASLGEVFSREAARAILTNADNWIADLTHEGILATATTVAAPLTGYWGELPIKRRPSSDYPLLGFTHTLLHRHLAEEESAMDYNALVAAIAENIPIYSVHAIQTLSNHSAVLTADAETMFGAIRRICEIAANLNRSPDWKLGHELWQNAWQLFESYKGRWSSDQERMVEACLISARLSLMVREMHSEEARTLKNRLMLLSADPVSTELGLYQLDSLAYQVATTFQEHQTLDLEVWKMAEELMQHFPSLMFTRKYIEFLRIVSMVAACIPDRKTVEMVERRSHEVQQLEDCPDETRTWLYKTVFPPLLIFFNTPEQARERRQLLHDLEEIIDTEDNTFHVWRIQFNYMAGYIDSTLRACDESLPRFIECGLRSNRFQAMLVRYALLVSRGLGLREMLAQSDALFVGVPEPLLGQMREEAGRYFMELGIACNDLEWTRQVRTQFLSSDSTFWNEESIMLAAADGNLVEVLQQILADESDDELDPALHALATLILGENAIDPDYVQEVVARSLRAEIFKRRNPLVKRAIIELVQVVEPDTARAGFATALRPAIHDGLILALEWYAERRMYPFMSPLLDLYGGYLTAKENTAWRSRIADIERGSVTQRARPQGDARLRVSMLGTITTQSSGEEPQRLRGARQRALLGLMVADRMLDKPLDQSEFRRLAAGGEEESHSARKTMNMGVHRLREAIGDDGVLTDEETPRLNIERVQVDLLDAVELVRAAREAFREGAMLRAWPALVQALEITRGEVSFPTLYDDFFEAVREDFEFELRSAIIDISRGLLAEGDATAAEQILRRGFDAMPEDEELSELLCRALESSGKRTAAERVRMQAAEV